MFIKLKILPQVGVTFSLIGVQVVQHLCGANHFMEAKIICGIYKITSPSGRMYIGQSIDILKRWSKQYQQPKEKLHCKDQPKLYNSLVKYGWVAHTFEIIEVCDIDYLNEREQFHVSLWNAKNGKVGMNCTIGGGGTKGLKWTEESKKRASESKRKMYDNGYISPLIGKPLSEERKAKISQYMKGLLVGDKNPFYGKKHTQDTLRIIGEKSIGRPKPIDFIERLKVRMTGETNPMYGVRLSGEKNGMYGKNHSQEACEAMAKLILNTETGIYYIGAKEAAKSIGMKTNTLISKLCRARKNNTSFIYV